MSADRLTYALRFHRLASGEPALAPGLRLETHVAGGTFSSTLSMLEGSTGALDGATGMIASNLLVNLDTDELIDTHLGIVRLP